MKLRIAGYEVEVKARNLSISDRTNKADTMHLLNLLSIYAKEASYKYGLEGCHGLEAEANQVSETIYELLKENGLYNKCSA